jgi:hypothetical protein
MRSSAPRCDRRWRWWRARATTTGARDGTVEHSVAEVLSESVTLEAKCIVWSGHFSKTICYRLLAHEIVGAQDSSCAMSR